QAIPFGMSELPPASIHFGNGIAQYTSNSTCFLRSASISPILPDDAFSPARYRRRARLGGPFRLRGAPCARSASSRRRLLLVAASRRPAPTRASPSNSLGSRRLCRLLRAWIVHRFTRRFDFREGLG